MANKKTAKKSAPKDFERKQVRVGKLKPGAANATNTNFVAKTIQAKDQSIPDEEGIMARRKDLLARLSVYISQMNHYSASFRKDALGSLYRLVKELPDIEMHITRITESLVKLMIDEDSAVRTLSLSAWNWIFTNDQLEDSVGTILNMVFPYLKLGLTHLKKDICADSARLVLTIVNECPLASKSYISELLPMIARHFSAKSFDQPKKTSVDLVEVFAKSCQILLADPTEKTTPIDYEWTELQVVSLRLPFRSLNLKISAINPDQIHSSLQVLNSALQVWSQVGYLMSSPSFAATDKEELELFKRCQSIISFCYRISKLANVYFDDLVPLKQRQSHSWLSLMRSLENI